jgi:flagellar motility protein MotE (MotC chaperone)
MLTSHWTAAICGAVLYLLGTVVFWKPPTLPPASASAETAGGASVPNGPSWEFTNPEADQLIAELKDERAALKKREQQLSDLAVRLAAEQTEVNQATQSVHQLQMDFDKNVVRIQEEETGNLKKLAKVYAEMSPESAAKVFTEMDDQSVIKIMVFMKDSETAAVFEAIAKTSAAEAKRVAALSESLRLASFRTNTAK